MQRKWHLLRKENGFKLLDGVVELEMLMHLNQLFSMHQHVCFPGRLDVAGVKLEDFIFVNHLLDLEEFLKILGPFVNDFAEFPL